MNQPFFPSHVVAEPAIPTTRPFWGERGNNAYWPVGALWLECALVWLFWHWGSFAHLDFRDPDDAMRLVQVRDFLAGQSWFDVSQHRVSPPHGGPMHWSRLLDLPIAGVIVMLRPLLGQAMAEIVACVTVPLITLATLCFGLFAAVRRFLDVHRALLTVALLVTSFPILTQMAPLRIDHHAWQIATAVGVLGGMLAADARKGGWIAGASMAMWLHISGEGLPFAAIAGGVFALRYAAEPREWSRLMRYVGVLAIGSAGLLLLTHGWTASLVTHCDSMSPPYLLPLALLFPAMLIGRRIAGDGTVLRRVAPVAIAGAGAAALFAAIGPECLAGPFVTLDPVVYRYWYLGVMEGQPFWRQGPGIAAIVLVPPLVGLVGLVLAIAREPDRARRMDWLSIMGLSLGSFIIAMLVLRAMSVAHMFALIGTACLIAHLYGRIRALPGMAERVGATVLLCALSPAGLTILANSAAETISGKVESPPEKVACSARPQIEALSALPRTTLFAPIDLGPAILQRTGHSVVATAHHRNVVGIGKVLRAYTQAPDEARRIVTASGARYLLFCPTLSETQRYLAIAPDGLAARLGKGQAPDWLRPVSVPGATDLGIFRIIPPAPRG